MSSEGLVLVVEALIRLQSTVDRIEGRLAWLTTNISTSALRPAPTALELLRDPARALTQAAVDEAREAAVRTTWSGL